MKPSTTPSTSTSTSSLASGTLMTRPGADSPAAAPLLPAVTWRPENTSWTAIGELRPGMHSIEFDAIITEFNGVHKTTVDGQQKDVYQFTVADPSGCVRLVLWGDHGKVFEPRQIVHIFAGYTKLYRNTLSLNLKKEGGRITRIGEFRMLFSLKPNMSIDMEWIPDPKIHPDAKNKSYIAVAPGTARQLQSQGPGAFQTDLSGPRMMPVVPMFPVPIPQSVMAIAPPTSVSAAFDNSQLSTLGNSIQQLSGMIATQPALASSPEIQKLKEQLTAQLQIFIQQQAAHADQNVSAALSGLKALLENTISSSSTNTKAPNSQDETKRSRPPSSAASSVSSAPSTNSMPPSFPMMQVRPPQGFPFVSTTGMQFSGRPMMLPPRPVPMYRPPPVSRPRPSHPQNAFRPRPPPPIQHRQIRPPIRPMSPPPTRPPPQNRQQQTMIGKRASAGTPPAAVRPPQTKKQRKRKNAPQQSQNSKSVSARSGVYDDMDTVASGRDVTFDDFEDGQIVDD